MYTERPSSRGVCRAVYGYCHTDPRFVHACQGTENQGLFPEAYPDRSAKTSPGMPFSFVVTFYRIQHKLFSISHAILLSPSFLLFYYTPLTCFYQISAVNVSINQISSYVFHEFVFVCFFSADHHQVTDKKILTWIILNSFYPDSTKPDYQIETS